MPNRFFMRFNQHNSICNLPAKAEIFSPMLGASKEELQVILDSFEAVQSNRADHLKQKYANELKCIKGKKVLFLGDSISSDNLGYRLAVTKAAELQSHDGCVSGGTSSTLIVSALSVINSVKPDIVSIMIGSNDSVCVERETQSLVSLAEYERNIRILLLWSKNSGSKIMLFGIPPVCESMLLKELSPQSKLQSNGNIKHYNEVLKKLSDEYGVTYISNDWMLNEENFDSLFEPDGLHLSIKGHDLFSERWIASAAKLYK